MKEEVIAPAVGNVIDEIGKESCHHRCSSSRSRRSPSRRQMKITELREESYFGEEEILNQESERKYSVVCTSAEGSLYALPRRFFEQALNHDPQFLEFFQVIVRKEGRKTIPCSSRRLCSSDSVASQKDQKTSQRESIIEASSRTHRTFLLDSLRKKTPVKNAQSPFYLSTTTSQQRQRVDDDSTTLTSRRSILKPASTAAAAASTTSATSSSSSERHVAIETTIRSNSRSFVSVEKTDYSQAVTEDSSSLESPSDNSTMNKKKMQLHSLHQTTPLQYIFPTVTSAYTKTFQTSLRRNLHQRFANETIDPKRIKKHLSIEAISLIPDKDFKEEEKKKKKQEIASTSLASGSLYISAAASFETAKKSAAKNILQQIFPSSSAATAGASPSSGKAKYIEVHNLLQSLQLSVRRIRSPPPRQSSLSPQNINSLLDNSLSHQPFSVAIRPTSSCSFSSTIRLQPQQNFLNRSMSQHSQSSSIKKAFIELSQASNCTAPAPALQLEKLVEVHKPVLKWSNYQTLDAGCEVEEPLFDSQKMPSQQSSPQRRGFSHDRNPSRLRVAQHGQQQRGKICQYKFETFRTNKQQQIK